MDLTIARIRGFSWDSQHFITIELDIVQHQFESRGSIAPKSRSYEGKVSNLEYIGKVDITGLELMEKAMVILSNFDVYNKYVLNCQHFCNRYLCALGFRRQTYRATDDDKIFLGGALGVYFLTLGLGVAFIIYRKKRQG